MIEKKSIIKDHSFEFALEVIGIYKDLIEKKKEYVLSKQHGNLTQLQQRLKAC